MAADGFHVRDVAGTHRLHQLHSQTGMLHMQTRIVVESGRFNSMDCRAQREQSSHQSISCLIRHCQPLSDLDLSTLGEHLRLNGLDLRKAL